MPTPTKQLSDYEETRETAVLRPAPNPRGTTEESLVDVGRYLGAVRRRLPVIAIVALLAAILGFVLAGRQPLSYEGVTTLLVVPPAQQTGPQINPATFRGIVENASLASQVIDELK